MRSGKLPNRELKGKDRCTHSLKHQKDIESEIKCSKGSIRPQIVVHIIFVLSIKFHIYTADNRKRYLTLMW